MNGVMAHVDTARRTLDEIEALPAPISMGTRHLPIPHAEVIHAVNRGLEFLGFGVYGSDYAVGGPKTAPDSKLFAFNKIAPIVDLEKDEETGLWVPREGYEEPPVSRALGYRNATAQAFALRIVGGCSVFVCDNMALSGEEIYGRKHTLGNMSRLTSEVLQSLEQWLPKQLLFEERFSNMKDRALTDEQARAFMFRVFEERALPLRFLPEVAQSYFAPGDEDTDILGRNAFGVHNAITRAFRPLPLHLKMEHTRNIAPLFNL